MNLIQIRFKIYSGGEPNLKASKMALTQTTVVMSTVKARALSALFPKAARLARAPKQKHDTKKKHGAGKLDADRVRSVLCTGLSLGVWLGGPESNRAPLLAPPI